MPRNSESKEITGFIRELAYISASTVIAIGYGVSGCFILRIVGTRFIPSVKNISKHKTISDIITALS